MTKSFDLQQTNLNVECPGSPDRNSELTESVEGDENFIALLQYRDAHHMLNLSPQESSHPIPPEVIQREYGSAKEQVLAALDRCEASDKQANGRNIFFVSQQNYLELKLKALDQAYEELMPMEAMGDFEEERDENSRIQEGAKDALGEEAPSKKSLEKEGPSISTNAAVKSVRNQKSSTQHHPRVPSEDELDTIDIYFRPSPNPPKSSDIRQSKSPAHSLDVSSCTWDGSSIFSMVSKTIQNNEEASVGGLSDVLGPVYACSPRDNKPQKGTKTPIINQSKDTRNQNFRRPPSGINSKHNKDGRPKAQISPKSVTDFPASIHNEDHYDNTLNFNTAEAVVGKGNILKRPRRQVVVRHNSHEATEAARMGILRALSEENSECLPLYDDNDDNSLNITYETTAKTTYSSLKKENGKPDRYFRGRSDRMPNATNSLMASVTNIRPVQPGQSTASSSCNGPSSPRSLSSSASSRSQRSNKVMTSPQTNSYDSLLQAGGYSYSAMLQSSLELADELCMAFNDCWKVDVVIPTAAPSRFNASSSEHDNAYLRDDESTYFTQSTHDESLTVNTRSVITGGDQSTAVTTLSSFPRRADSPTLVSETTDSSVPSPRMFV